MEMIKNNGISTLKYTPKNKDELKTLSCWEDCKCNLEIIGFCIYNSKNSGKDMPKLTVKAYHPDGIKSQFIIEYINIDDDGKYHKRLNEIFECFGIDYEKGNVILEENIGKFGEGIIKTQHDKTGQYDSKNAIKKYLPKENKKNQEDDFKDDDLPF